MEKLVVRDNKICIKINMKEIQPNNRYHNDDIVPVQCVHVMKITLYSIVTSLLGDINEKIYDLHINNKIYDKFNAYKHEYELKPIIKEVKEALYYTDYYDLKRLTLIDYINRLHKVYLTLDGF